MLDYLIIGAGITGVSVARLLQKRGCDNFLIIEAENEAGGLCRTKKIDGHVVDIGGGHFLFSVYPEVYEFVFSHIPKNNFNRFDRVTKIKIAEHIIDYPIESNLWQLPMNMQIKYLISAVQSGEVLGKSEPKNYEQWIRWKLGDCVADNYMIPYNKKIWGVDPKKMDIDWLHKIPRLNTEEIVRSCLSHMSDKNKFPTHIHFYYPKIGGFQKIFDAIYKRVESKIKLNEPIKSLAYKKDYWMINNQYKAKVIINTAPWIYIYKALGNPKVISKPMKILKANEIVVSLWEKPYSHDWHWLYVPDLSIEHHREFFISNFALDSKPGGYFSETNISRWKGKKSLYDYRNRYAYPIPVTGHSKAIKTVLEYFEPMNLYGVGRWGQWKYFNSDICIWEAMKLVNRMR